MAYKTGNCMYEKSDLVKLTWEDFDKYLDKIKKDIREYLEKSKLQIDVIVPILRGGGIPGIRLALEFKIVRILPFQYKYLHEGKRTNMVKLLNSDFNQLSNFNKKDPVILVVEGNHSTGGIAIQVISDIKKQLPKSKIIYVSLAKDYFYKDSVKENIFTTCGYYTNENRKLSKEKCLEIGINSTNIYLFPWESPEEELAMLNQQSFDYNL